MICDVKGPGGVFVQAADLRGWLQTAAMHGYEVLSLAEIAHMLYEQNIKCSSRDLTRFAYHLVERRDAEWTTEGHIQLSV